MDLARIAAQLHPFLDRTLSAAQLQQISTYINLLIHWNARTNLTAIRDPEEIVPRHFGESFFLARHLFPDPNVARAPSPALPQSPIRVLDIGSGAGFPGLPIKIWDPAIDLTLVESNHKKATFLREVIRALALINVNVIAARAETLLPTHPHADIVTMRAVEHFETILPIACSLRAPKGRLAVLIGTSQLPTLANRAPTLSWSTPVPIPQSDSRVLSISIPQ